MRIPWAPLFTLLRPHWRTLLMATAAMAVLALSSAAYAYLLGPLLALVFTGSDGGVSRMVALPGELQPGRFSLLLLIFLVAVVKGAAYFGQLYSMAKLGQAIAARLRLRLFDALIAGNSSSAAETVSLSSRLSLGIAPGPEVDPRPHKQTGRGDWAARLGADVEAVQSGLVELWTALMRDGVSLLALVALAFWLDPMLATLTLVGLPLAILPIVRFGRRLRRSTVDANEAHGAMAARLVELLNYRAHLRSSAARAAERSLFESEVNRIQKARLHATAIRAIHHPLMELLGVTSLCLAIVVAASRMDAGELQASSLMSIFAALIMLYEPLKSLSKSSASLHEAAAGWQRLELAIGHGSSRGPIEEQRAHLGNQSGTTMPLEERRSQPGPLAQAVAMKGVRLRRGEQWVLDGIDLELGAESCVVLFGASGAGKSSLLKLLAGLLSADAGELFWDGQPFSSLDPDVLARRIGYLDQEASCVGRSIRANLSQGEMVEERRLVDALQRARAWDWVQGRGGLDAVLEESAQDLSGGQRRRLALARALVQSPSLLLLDEPTDAVDPQTERALLAELEALKGSTTLVLVVHQPDAVAWADKYYCLQDGHLLERAGARLQPSE